MFLLYGFLLWVGLNVVGVNLSGLILRGLLWRPPSFEDAPTERVKDILRAESAKLIRSNRIMTIGPIIATCAYVWASYTFGNAYMAIAAFLSMTIRVTDQLWEMDHGEPFPKNNPPQGFIYMIGTIISVLNIPLICYAIYIGNR